jgi:hypothetical protein
VPDGCPERRGPRRRELHGPRKHGTVRGNVLRAAGFTTAHTGGKKPWVFNNEAAHSGEVVDVMRRGAFDARADEFGRARAKAMGGPFSRAAQAPIPAHPHQPVLSGSVMDEPLGLEAPVDDRFPWEQDTARDVLGVGTGPW